MAEWFSSALKTCVHRCDYPKISSDSKLNEQEIDCAESGVYTQPRRLLITSIQWSLTGSFYGGNRNVRGHLVISVYSPENVWRMVSVSPFGGYLYHNDYGYYSCEGRVYLNIETDYLNKDVEFRLPMKISIVNENNLDANCDAEVYVTTSFRVRDN